VVCGLGLSPSGIWAALGHLPSELNVAGAAAGAGERALAPRGNAG
jgi:hypothetical protein